MKRLSDAELNDVEIRVSDGKCHNCAGTGNEQPWRTCRVCDGAGVFALSTETMLSVFAELRESRAILAAIRDDFDAAIAAHDPSDPRHRSHGGQHTNGRCCAFGNLNPGALSHMRRLLDLIDKIGEETNG